MIWTTRILHGLGEAQNLQVLFKVGNSTWFFLNFLSMCLYVIGFQFVDLKVFLVWQPLLGFESPCRNNVHISEDLLLKASHNLRAMVSMAINKPKGIGPNIKGKDRMFKVGEACGSKASPRVKNKTILFESWRSLKLRIAKGKPDGEVPTKLFLFPRNALSKR